MNIWLVIYRVSCAAFAVIVIIAVVSIFLPRIRENEERQKRAAVLEEENRAKAEMTEELRDRQEQFRSDPRYVERIAREKLGKAKPGEVIFRFTDTETNAVRRP